MSFAEWFAGQGASTEALRFISLANGGTPLAELSLLRALQEATRSKVDVQRVSQQAGMQGKDVFERLPTLKNSDLPSVLPHNWCAPLQPASPFVINAAVAA